MYNHCGWFRIQALYIPLFDILCSSLDELATTAHVGSKKTVITCWPLSKLKELCSHCCKNEMWET